MKKNGTSVGIGRPGLVGGSSNNNGLPQQDGSPEPQYSREVLAQQACQPLRMSAEFDQAVRDCLARHEALHRPKPATLLGRMGGALVTWSTWNPHLLAKIIATAILLGSLIWAGCRVGHSLPPSIVRHRNDINQALSE